MLIDVLKFIHLLLTLSLLGTTFIGLMLISFKYSIYDDAMVRLNRVMLWLLVFGMLTGTLLIYPKHFTFHTPWIQAAYLLVFLFGMVVSFWLIFRKKFQRNLVWGIGYVFLLIILIAIIHDAVTKTPFWHMSH